MHSFFAPISWRLHFAPYLGHIIGAMVFVFVLLGLLQLAPRPWRKGIIALFTFLGGVFYPLEFFWPAQGKPSHNFLTPYNEVVATLSAVIGSFAIGLGVISLLQLHTRTIARQRPGWGNSVALVTAFVLMTVYGLLNQYHKTDVAIPAVGSLWHAQTNGDVFKFLFKGGLNNLGAAVFSLIAFYIASASYRAFRIRSVESSLLMAAALIVMLGSVTIGTALTSWIPDNPNPLAMFRLEHISEWLLIHVNAPAQRGILFGLTIGGLAVSLRLWLSLERGAYFDKEV